MIVLSTKSANSLSRHLILRYIHTNHHEGTAKISTGWISFNCQFAQRQNGSPIETDLFIVLMTNMYEFRSTGLHRLQVC